MLDTTPAPDVARQPDIPETPDISPDDRRIRPDRWYLRVPRPPRRDLIAVGVLVLGALYLFGHLLTGPTTHYLAGSSSDGTQVCWWLAWVAKTLPHGTNPLHVTAQNAPVGFNGMGNTMVLALSVAFIPVTLLFGPEVSYVLMLVGGVAGTACAWYWLFSRHLVRSTPAAVVAAALCSYGPPMASHANGHVNIAVHFAVPLIIGTALRLAEPGRTVRRGLLLGLLAVVQLLIGEEVMLIAALGLGVFLAALGVQRPGDVARAWRRTLGGLAIGAAVALAATGYLLWYQFLGPLHYSGLPYLYWYSSDVTTLTRLPANSLAGNATSLAYSFNGPAEQNAFFGVPLLVLSGLLVVWLWRDAVVRAAAATGALFALLSFGTAITVNNRYTGVPGPWKVLHKVPVLDSLTPSRLTMITMVMIAIVLARGLDRVADLAPAAARVNVPLRPIAAAAVALALVPLAPLPLRAGGWPKVPAFFTDGTWRRYISEGGTVVAVPVTRSPEKTAGLNWQLATDLDFTIAGGYFLAPWDADKNGGDGHGWFNAKPRATSTLLDGISDTGVPTSVNDADRAAAVTDLRYWHAQVMVLDPADPAIKHPDTLKSVVDQLVGPGVFVDGVWVWNVRSLSGAA